MAVMRRAAGVLLAMPTGFFASGSSRRGCFGTRRYGFWPIARTHRGCHALKRGGNLPDGHLCRSFGGGLLSRRHSISVSIWQTKRSHMVSMRRVRLLFLQWTPCSPESESVLRSLLAIAWDSTPRQKKKRARQRLLKLQLRAGEEHAGCPAEVLRGVGKVELSPEGNGAPFACGRKAARIAIEPCLREAAISSPSCGQSHSAATTDLDAAIIHWVCLEI